MSNDNNTARQKATRHPYNPAVAGGRCFSCDGYHEATCTHSEDVKSMDGKTCLTCEEGRETTAGCPACGWVSGHKPDCPSLWTGRQTGRAVTGRTCRSGKTGPHMHDDGGGMWIVHVGGRLVGTVEIRNSTYWAWRQNGMATEHKRGFRNHVSAAAWCCQVLLAELSLTMDEIGRLCRDSLALPVHPLVTPPARETTPNG